MITISLISSCLASMMLIFMAGFVLVKDWRDQVNRYYVYFALSAFIILSTMFVTYAYPESPHLPQINRLTQMGTVLFFSSLFTMSLVFPKIEKRFPFKYTVLVLVPAFSVGAIAVGTDLTITNAYFKNGSLVREFRFFYTIYAVIAFLYLILGTANFIYKYIKTDVSIYRLQMRFMFVGTSLAVVVAAVCSIILPRFFNFAELYVLGPSLASFIGFGSLFYSVISYNLMDITTAVHKTTTYAIISAAIFVPIYLTVMSHDANIWGLGQMPLYLLAVVIVLLFIFYSIYIQPSIDRAFKRKQYEFEGMLDNFIRDVGKVRDYASLIRRSVDILYRSLFLKRAFFLMFDDTSKRYELYYQKGDSLPVAPVERTSTVIRWFVRNQEVLHVDRVYTDDKSFAEIREGFIEFFTGNKVKVLLPMYHERRLLGLLCLGEKDTLSSYKPDELEKLGNFQTESNIHISNAMIYEESKRQQLLTRTMDLASDVLAKSVPKALPNLTGLKFGAFVIPRYGEGIDYFDFIRPDNSGVGIIATDIAGVGVNSALNSVVLRSAFQSCIEEAPSTYTVIQKLNHVLYEYSGGQGALITAYYMYYDLRSMRLIYTNAGFPSMELYRVDKNDFDSLDTEGIPIGYDPKANYGMGRTNLLRGDIGVIYSKALINSKNQKGEPFGLLKLRALIKEHRAEQPQEMARIIKDEFISFLGLSAPESDIVMILFKTM